ncbi:linker for activation of T-cells family member 2 [Leptosomus discolor]
MAQLELLWAAAALMLLGAAVSLCVKCQLSATKREKQPSERRSQLERQQRFEVIRSHSATARRLEQIKEPENFSIARKTTKALSTSCHAGYTMSPVPEQRAEQGQSCWCQNAQRLRHLTARTAQPEPQPNVSLCLSPGSRAELRYQNFLTEDCLQGDSTYVEPISLDYYNCARFFTPPNEKEEDSHSYENFIAGVSLSSDLVTDDAVDYENSTAIDIWKLQQVEALQADSLDDEPDYINTAPASGPAPPSKQSILCKV